MHFTSFSLGPWPQPVGVQASQCARARSPHSQVRLSSRMGRVPCPNQGCWMGAPCADSSTDRKPRTSDRYIGLPGVPRTRPLQEQLDSTASSARDFPACLCRAPPVRAQMAKGCTHPSGAGSIILGPVSFPRAVGGGWGRSVRAGCAHAQEAQMNRERRV